MDGIVVRAHEVEAVGAKVAAASERSRAASTSASHRPARAPLPTATRQPTMLRIM